MNEFVAQVMAFRGDDEYITATNVLIEVTDVKGDEVEIAFEMPTPKKERVYVTVSLTELVRRAVTFNQKD